ncbi:MAG TPA: hypothetical protein VHZ09_19190 [Acidobacteriaceae bacterium]|jgi:hypothetical protein|nr:hypothetical protein [Acidobacteriaceae bacterium]
MIRYICRIGLLLIAVAAMPASLLCQSRTGKDVEQRHFKVEFGNIESRYDEAPWPSPELLLRDIQADSESARLSALLLLGADHEDLYEPLHGKNGDREEVATPWQSELLFASLGDNATTDAIVGIQIRNLVIAAVAVPRAGGWERIAAFKCLCPSNNTDDSYGTNNGNNLLQNTVEVGRYVSRGFERHELIVSAIEFPVRGDQVVSFSDYTQHEAHFGVYAGKLRRTIAFDRRTHPCGAGCTIHRQFFYRQNFGPDHEFAGGILVDAEAPVRPTDDTPCRTDFEEIGLRISSCSDLIFNEKTYRFEPYSPSEPASTDPCRQLLAISH